MKKEAEVQRAHDILIAFLLGEVPIKLPKETDTALRIAYDVLCWCLEHNHNTHFAKNLKTLENLAHQKGYQLTEYATKEP